MENFCFSAVSVQLPTSRPEALTMRAPALSMKVSTAAALTMVQPEISM